MDQYKKKYYVMFALVLLSNGFSAWQTFRFNRTVEQMNVDYTTMSAKYQACVSENISWSSLARKQDSLMQRMKKFIEDRISERSL